MPKNNIYAPMLRILTAVFFVVLALGAGASVSRGDDAGAEKGKKVFQERGCGACHTIGGGKLAGPDLAGVTKRRDAEWLTKWLKSPDTMVMTDPIAKEMLQEFMVPMPNLGLSDDEVKALIEYFKSEDAGKK